MKIKYLFAVTLVAGLGLSFEAASAAAASGVPAQIGSGITLVEGGCGPGGHRDRFGYCRPNYAPPPRYYRCPPYYHPTPYGCRPNY